MRLTSLRVFLSYSRADEKAVREIEELLSEVDIDSWFDRETLVGGQDWKKAISRGIGECDIVVVCLSKEGIAREGYFLEEVELACRLQREAPNRFDIVPLRLDDAPLPEPLEHLHWVDFFVEAGPDLLFGMLRYYAEKHGRQSVVDVPADVARLPAEQAAAPEAGRGELGHVASDQAALSIAEDGGGPARSFRNRRPSLLWGDTVALQGERDGHLVVGACGETCLAEEKDIGRGGMQMLSIEFLELGGGCAALAIAPDGRRFVFNAGHGDYLCRYLQWRFGGPDEVVDLDCVVLTHGATDHYEGLRAMLDSGCFRIGTVFHNGLFMHAAQPRPRGGRDRRVGVVGTAEDLRAWIGRSKPNRYSRLMADALDSPRVGDVAMLDRSDGYLPGFGPGNGGPAIEVVWPRATRSSLPYLGSHAETLRGNSIVLRARYGDVRVLLRSELGKLGEECLLNEYGPDLEEVLHADLARMCFHGSKSFSPDFMAAVWPAGCVVGAGRRSERYPYHGAALTALGDHCAAEAVLATGENNLSLNEPAIIRGLRRQLRLYEDRVGARPAASALPEPARTRYLTALRRYGTFLSSNQVVHLRTDGNRALLARRDVRRRGWEVRPFARVGDRLRLEEPPNRMRLRGYRPR